MLYEVITQDSREKKEALEKKTPNGMKRRPNPDATVTIHVSISESGMGQRSSLVKMAAEVLQLPLERISVTPADTLVNLV